MTKEPLPPNLCCSLSLIRQCACLLPIHLYLLKIPGLLGTLFDPNVLIGVYLLSLIITRSKLVLDPKRQIRRLVDNNGYEVSIMLLPNYPNTSPVSIWSPICGPLATLKSVVGILWNNASTLEDCTLSILFARLFLINDFLWDSGNLVSAGIRGDAHHIGVDWLIDSNSWILDQHRTWLEHLTCKRACIQKDIVQSLVTVLMIQLIGLVCKYIFYHEDERRIQQIHRSFTVSRTGFNMAYNQLGISSMLIPATTISLVRSSGSIYTLDNQIAYILTLIGWLLHIVRPGLHSRVDKTYTNWGFPATSAIHRHDTDVATIGALPFTRPLPKLGSLFSGPASLILLNPRGGPPILNIVKVMVDPCQLMGPSRRDYNPGERSHQVGFSYSPPYNYVYVGLLRILD
ncbi:hypothetical protein G9A89_000228, partial [Geosiphon pyriformis]